MESKASAVFDFFKVQSTIENYAIFLEYSVDSAHQRIY